MTGFDARVNHGKNIALRDHLAVFEPDFNDGTADLRAKLDFLDRTEAAREIVPKAHGLAMNAFDRNRRGLWCSDLNGNFVGIGLCDGANAVTTRSNRDDGSCGRQQHF